MKTILSKVNRWVQQASDKFTGAEQPKVYFNPQGQVKDIVSSLPQLQQKYRPTPWLANTHLHLMYFDMIKKKSVRLQYDRIEQVTMQDGGVTGIAWLGLDLPTDTPTVVLMHTITGTPESMAELVRDLNQYTGWRVALCLRRGHAGLPMPVPKINLFGFTADLREQIALIQQKFPKSDLYAVGSSAGTWLLVRYLGEEGDKTPFKAAFALCPGYNTESSFENVHPFYNKIMAKKLVKRFIQPYQDTWQDIQSLPDVLASKTLVEFERRYYELTGFADYSSYSQATNPIYVFENIKIPLLILNSEDDPVCHIKNLEPYKATMFNMQNVAVITTKKGSHCGFYEGSRTTHSWANRLIANFFLVQTQAH